jgi:hypothetical protein
MCLSYIENHLLHLYQHNAAIDHSIHGNSDLQSVNDFGPQGAAKLAGALGQMTSILELQMVK